jgi:hypothetical protein
LLRYSRSSRLTLDKAAVAKCQIAGAEEHHAPGRIAAL